MSSREAVGEAWIGIAEIYGRELSKAALGMFLEATSDLDQAKVLAALKNWVKVSKHMRYPLPAEIREMIAPVVDDETIAKEIASRISQTVSSCGYSNQQAAKTLIGELGWAVVERWGGWQYICENLGTTMDLGTFQAQARDLTKAMLKIEKSERQIMSSDLHLSGKLSSILEIASKQSI